MNELIDFFKRHKISIHILYSIHFARNFRCEHFNITESDKRSFSEKTFFGFVSN